MAKKIKRDLHGHKINPARSNIPPNARVDPGSTCTRHFVYRSEELQMVAYRGGADDINISTVGGNENVFQFVVKGRCTFQRSDSSPLQDLRTGEYRDTFASKVDGVTATYTMKTAGTEFICIKAKNRTLFPYRVLDFNNNAQIDITGPAIGARNLLVIALEGAVDFTNENSGEVDRLETLLDHIEIEPGNQAGGVSIGKTKLLIIE